MQPKKNSVKWESDLGVFLNEKDSEVELDKASNRENNDSPKKKKRSVQFLSEEVRPKIIEMTTVGRFFPPEMNRDDDEPKPEDVIENLNAPYIQVEPESPTKRIEQENQSRKSLVKDGKSFGVLELEKDLKKKQSGAILGKKIGEFLESKLTSGFMFFFTLYALFGDDIRRGFLSVNEDIIFDILFIICLAIFTIEIVLSFIVIKAYRWSFFFYLDILSTISLIFDITWIENSLTQDKTSNASSLARAGRASRLGSKASRVVRLVRLIRITKLFKSSFIFKKNQELSKALPRANPKPDVRSPTDANKLSLDKGVNKSSFESVSGGGSTSPRNSQTSTEDDQEIKISSKVSKRLSDLTTMRVITIVLSILLFVPLFSYGYYNDDVEGFEYNFKYLEALYTNSTAGADDGTNEELDGYCNHYISVFKSSLLSFTTPIQTKACTNFTQGPSIDDLRSEEKLVACWTNENFCALISVQDRTRITAYLNMGRTIYVCFILMIGSWTFTLDLDNLLLHPIERMISIVNKLVKNPLSIRNNSQALASKDQALETKALENSLVKIASLLALGFGEAGSEIIASIISKNSKDIDALIPGKKKCAVFGFCDIRNFTDATEVLQEEVLVFVNNIADIVHSIVDRFQGSANKNIGDAFLLIWKIPEKDYKFQNGELVYCPSKKMINVCDLSLFSFLKIIGKINTSEKILSYRYDARLNQRIPNYKVKMGFGLHIGWGIEGAIGSIYKIDASYLSPNVNMASRLEAATKQYGSILLISNVLYDNLSVRAKEICRKIDVVTVKGSTQPVGLYTVDLNTNDLKPSVKPKRSEKKKSNLNKRSKKSIILEMLNKDELIADHILQNDIKLKKMLRHVDDVELFRKRFDEAFKLYQCGRWKEAKTAFELVVSMKPDEGPSKTLINFMSEHGFEADKDWQGVRELTEK